MALTPATIPALLERHGLAPSRALGQNFLSDPNTARRIVRLAGVEAGEFPPRPHEERICSYCAYASVCRKDYVGDE